MGRHTRRAVFAAWVAAVGGLVVATPTPAAGEGSGDDGQVIVTPVDPYGQNTRPGVDMWALQNRGEAPVRRGGPRATSPSPGEEPPAGGALGGIPPGCFLGGFGAGGGPGGTGPGGSAFGLRCLPPLPTQPAPPLPTPAELAAQAFEQLRLPLPVPRHSPNVQLPDGRDATIVGENTWVWTDRSVWRRAVRRVQVGPVWAGVTAAPVGMAFTSGTGGSMSCSGPGTPYNRTYGLHAASPDCGFVYTRSSYGQPNDEATAEWAIHWSVSWVGSDGTGEVGGDFPQMLSRATEAFAVAEVQALRAN